MSDFMNSGTSGSLAAKLWRGERMCLLGMDVKDPEPDFVGFSIEVKSPGKRTYSPLRNRIAFSYDKPAAAAVNGFRNYSSLQAPFQKFRWIHFPYDPKDGTYRYRITKQHMPSDNKLVAGDSKAVDIPLSKETYSDFLDIGFTRSFASSQAYVDKFHNDPHVIPSNTASGLSFDKTKSPAGVYEWLGFEAYDLIFSLLDEVVNDTGHTAQKPSPLPPIIPERCVIFGQKRQSGETPAFRSKQNPLTKPPSPYSGFAIEVTEL